MNLIERTNQAIEYLNNYDGPLTDVEKATGISNQWLYAFRAGKYLEKDVGVKQVQKVLDFFENQATA